MRIRNCVPMITLLLLLSACGSSGDDDTVTSLRDRYHDMTGCSMEATVSCTQENLAWEAQLRCDYSPDGPCTIEVLAPEELAGVTAVLEESDWRLEYQDDVLNAGFLSRENISPMACLPRLMNALRDGWLLEENQEVWNDTPCLRLTVDQSGVQDGKILSTLWLRLDDGSPLRGEIAVDGSVILTADFTSFQFYDILSEDAPEDG